MRLMLGVDGHPTLLVNVSKFDNQNNFDFDVVNGRWSGKFQNGFITVYGAPSGDFTDHLTHHTILTQNQDRLRSNFRNFDSYNEVFANFQNPDYIAPQYTRVKFDDMDDDIPF
jgi:hypothetical protein